MMTLAGLIAVTCVISARNLDTTADTTDSMGTHANIVAGVMCSHLCCVM